MNKACVQCKWHFDSGLYPVIHSCTHPTARGFDPVHGGTFALAEHERAPNGGCGPEGRRWQPTRAARFWNWLTEAA